MDLLSLFTQKLIEENVFKKIKWEGLVSRVGEG